MTQLRLYERDRDGMLDAMAWQQEDNQVIPHFHSPVEVIYVEDGELLVTQNGVQSRAEKGQIIVNSCYVVHGYATAKHCRTLVAMLPPGIAPGLRAALMKGAFIRNILSAEEIPECYPLLQMMLGPSQSSCYVNGLGQAVLALLVENIGLKENAANGESDLLRRILEYVQAHAAEPISVADTAAYFGYSAGRFSHIFNQQVGCSFTTYVNGIRCMTAHRLLAEGGQSLIDVANACGFSSLRTFHRVYKAFAGETPRAAASRSLAGQED